MKKKRTATTLSLLFALNALVLCGCVIGSSVTDVHVYQDLNGNGKADPGEPGFANLRLGGGMPFPTDANGDSSYTALYESADDCKNQAQPSIVAPSGYKITQSDVPALDCGSISVFDFRQLARTVTFGLAPVAQASSPTATAAPSTPTAAPATATATAGIAAAPGIKVTITGVTPKAFTGPSQLISFMYKFTNTGNVDLPGPFTVNDLTADPSTVQCTQDPAVARLAVGQTISCASEYVTGATDVDAAKAGHPLYERVTVSTTFNSLTVQGQAETSLLYQALPTQAPQPTGTKPPPTKEVPATPTG